MRPIGTIFDRLAPALLMATSVTLLTAGLLSYAPSTFGDWRTPDPDLIGGYPLLTNTPVATPSGATPQPHVTIYPSSHPSKAPRSPAGSPTHATPTPPVPPIRTPGPTPTPQTGQVGLASRIRIPSLGIDLPVVANDLVVPGNRDNYPLCDVAMFMRDYVQPGQSGATYIYAHAQRGMFAPLLKASEIADGATLVGALIEVYTSDNVLHLYELYKVKRHATDLSLANPPPGEHMLVLQTSEGPSGTVPKLQVAARPLSVVPATPAEANPPPHPRVCLPS
jgi:hypothetical protein